MNKLYPMKQYLSVREQQAVKVLKNVPPRGVFNMIIRNTANECKVDNVRQLFKMINDQVKGTGPKRVAEVIGAEALEAVMKLSNQ
jgi:hypothetical protein